MVILIHLNCFLLSFSYFGKTHQQSTFDSNDSDHLENGLSQLFSSHQLSLFILKRTHSLSKRLIFRDRPTSMVTTKRNTHSTQIQTLLQTACNATDSVPLTCQQVGWFIDRRGKPVGGLRWRRRVPPSSLAGRPAVCRLLLSYCHPPTSLLLLLL